MRWQLTFLVALIACADDGGSADTSVRCEQGPGVHDDAVAALAEASPGCTRDDECMLIDTALRCEGFHFGDCGTVVHADAARDWDASAVCRAIEQLPAQRGVVCETSPSCMPALPACIAGRCARR